MWWLCCTENQTGIWRESLPGVHLTQRLTAARFERLNSELPGKETRQALLAIADEAAFLDLPPADLLDLPAPNRAAQGRMVSQAAAFVATTVSRMPDFIGNAHHNALSGCVRDAFHREALSLPSRASGSSIATKSQRCIETGRKLTRVRRRRSRKRISRRNPDFIRGASSGRCWVWSSQTY